MKIGTTSTGETINFDDSPFDTAHLQIPGLGIDWNTTNDMGSGNALTMQPTGTANMSNQPDWNGNSHFNHSNSHQGQGNLIVLRNSNTSKMMNLLYNAVNPLGSDGQQKSIITIQNAKKMWFNVLYYNLASVDGNNHPHVFAIAEGCFFNNPSTLQVSNGSNNAQNTETWTYLSTTMFKTEGNPVSTAGQPTNGVSVNMGPLPTI